MLLGEKTPAVNLHSIGRVYLPEQTRSADARTSRLSSYLVAVLCVCYASWSLLRYAFLKQSLLVVYLPFLVFPAGFAPGPILLVTTRTILLNLKILISEYWLMISTALGV